MQKYILDFLSEFAVFLQDHKFVVPESALAHLLRSVEAAGVDITEEDEMLAALSVCLAKTGEQVAKMKALFREFLSKKNNPAKGVVCSKRLLNQAVGKSLRTHNLKPKKGAQVMRKNEKITALYERLSRDDFGKDDDQQRESNSISNQDGICQGGFLQKLQIVQ